MTLGRFAGSDVFDIGGCRGQEKDEFWRRWDERARLPTLLCLGREIDWPKLKTSWLAAGLAGCEMGSSVAPSLRSGSETPLGRRRIDDGKLLVLFEGDEDGKDDACDEEDCVVDFEARYCLSCGKVSV